ncbi:MAG: sugar ABC transporter ATP-binding protein [Rhodobacteraceae bacterium]|jgi:ABC-type sugar transport system ATPase subunit|nr:sugar ABC transporter ATP-binding protein [Paracoccaceae bacterium]
MSSTTTALRMRGITKAFPGVVALSDVDLTVGFGTIHAIVGENGAGKSTLMKVLSGAIAPTAGTIAIAGAEVRLRRPADAQRLGLRMVHQELNLAPDLTVAENVFLGRMPKRWGMVDRSRMLADTQALLARLGAQIAADARLGDLPISQQQVVEITKAYAANPRIIVLDEPTSSVSEAETAALFGILRRMKSQGVAIIYISHRLREVLEIADEVTILRDGRMIDSRPAAGITAPQMIRHMVGRDVGNVFPKSPAVIGATVLQVEGLSDGRHFTDMSLDVRQGEILGVTGLVGAGRTELARVLFGLERPTAGRILVRGRAVSFRSPADAVRAGIAYVPEDRKAMGIVPAMSIRENVSLPILRRMSRAGWIRSRQDAELARGYVRDLGISPPDPERQIRLLSGGNQQKAVIAKWLATRPSVLILDEPTRGVDVGAKAEIHRIVGDLVAGGMAVIMISSELIEVIGVCDRVLVMRDGRAAGLLDRAALREERIMALATGEDAA